MSDRMIRWGVVVKTSADKGPHKLVEVECDGKVMEAYVGETFGVQASPHQDAHVLIAVADGDEGKATIISSMPRPKDRTDQQKPGEVSIVNHDTGNRIHHNADGHTVVTTRADLTETVGGSRDTSTGGSVIMRSGGIIHLNP